MGNSQSSSSTSTAVATTATTVTSAQLSTFQFYAQYAAAAYCNADSSDVGQLVTCTSDACPTVQSNEATILQVVSDDSTGTAGYIGVDPAEQVIIVSFQGSDDVASYLTDLNFMTTDCDELVDDCKVHMGFYSAWIAMSTDTISAVQAAVSAYPSYNVITTGHSLGAALATLAGTYLRQSGISADIYTYGSPRVGNTEFVNFVDAQSSGSEYRFTHVDDIVPRLPPTLLGYRHTDVEYWLSTGDAYTTDYAASDIVVCQGIENKDCNGGESSLDTKAHSYYFMHISACKGE